MKFSLKIGALEKLVAQQAERVAVLECRLNKNSDNSSKPPSSYNYLPDENRQVRWAHLKRDFTKISEGGGKIGSVGFQLLKLRPLVISKKLTFGTQSDRGSRFIERAFTAIMTCQQQKIPILELLQNAVQLFFKNKPLPV